MTADLSERMQAKQDIFKCLKDTWGNKNNLEFYTLWRKSFKKQRENRVFQTGKPKEFVTNRPTLSEMLKEGFQEG